jgi:hypothetical protein
MAHVLRESKSAGRTVPWAWRLVLGGALLLTVGAPAAEYDWGPLDSGMNSTVYALTEFNGELIAGGSFTTAGGTNCMRIARWDGNTWQPLGSGMGGPEYPNVQALTVYNG